MIFKVVCCVFGGYWGYSMVFHFSQFNLGVMNLSPECNSSFDNSGCLYI